MVLVSIVGNESLVGVKIKVQGVSNDQFCSECFNRHEHYSQVLRCILSTILCATSSRASGDTMILVSNKAVVAAFHGHCK